MNLLETLFFLKKKEKIFFNIHLLRSKSNFSIRIKLFHDDDLLFFIIKYFVTVCIYTCPHTFLDQNSKRN